MVSYKDFDFFVFDWDGTVLDTISSIICSYQYACKEMGFPVPDDDVVRSTIGLSTEKCLRICCPDCPPERFSEYFGFYTSHYLPREANLQLIDGMETLLRDMHAAGLRLGIATGKSNKGMKRVLTKTVWRSCLKVFKLLTIIFPSQIPPCFIRSVTIPESSARKCW